MGLERTLMFFGSMVTCTTLSFAVCSKFWAEFYFKEKKYHAGLWTVCPENGIECVSFDEWMENEHIPSWLQNVRILTASACTLSGLALTMSLIVILHSKFKNVYTSVLQFLVSAVVAGVCVIFSDNKHFYNHEKLYHADHLWAFYLSAATSIWSFLMALFGIMADHCMCILRTSDHDYGIHADNV